MATSKQPTSVALVSRDGLRWSDEVHQAACRAVDLLKEGVTRKAVARAVAICAKECPAAQVEEIDRRVLAWRQSKRPGWETECPWVVYPWGSPHLPNTRAVSRLRAVILWLSALQKRLQGGGVPDMREAASMNLADLRAEALRFHDELRKDIVEEANVQTPPAAEDRDTLTVADLCRRWDCARQYVHRLIGTDLSSPGKNDRGRTLVTWASVARFEGERDGRRLTRQPDRQPATKIDAAQLR